MRRHVATFYAFARAADDIADNPDLEAPEKIRRLDGFEGALLGNGDPAYQKANDMGESLRVSGVSPRHCQDILGAFRQDASKSRYRNWPELIAYCRLSAAPVGRFLIDLHGGSRLGYWPSDALCAALQLLNHLQDCGDDYRSLDRVYLPMDWLAEADADLSDLEGQHTTAALRRALDRMLVGIDMLLRDAGALPASLCSKRLALEASVIIQIAHRLRKRLGQGDPLSRRIELSKTDLAFCSFRGLVGGL